MKPRRLRSFPRSLIAVLATAAGDPPALARKAVALADDEHRQLRLAARRRVLVDRAQDLAQGAHLRPREGIAEPFEQLAIAQARCRPAPRRRGAAAPPRARQPRHSAGARTVKRPSVPVPFGSSRTRKSCPSSFSFPVTTRPRPPSRRRPARNRRPAPVRDTRPRPCRAGPKWRNEARPSRRFPCPDGRRHRCRSASSPDRGSCSRCRPRPRRSAARP